MQTIFSILVQVFKKMAYLPKNYQVLQKLKWITLSKPLKKLIVQ